LGGGAAIVQAAAPVNPVVPLTHTIDTPTPLANETIDVSKPVGTDVVLLLV
jgi:hypothetical protein